MVARGQARVLVFKDPCSVRESRKSSTSYLKARLYVSIAPDVDGVLENEIRGHGFQGRHHRLPRHCHDGPVSGGGYNADEASMGSRFAALNGFRRNGNSIESDFCHRSSENRGGRGWFLRLSCMFCCRFNTRVRYQESNASDYHVSFRQDGSAATLGYFVSAFCRPSNNPRSIESV